MRDSMAPVLCVIIIYFNQFYFVFSSGSLHLDPFDNPYLSMFRQIDHRYLMKMPILDDKTFMLRVNQSFDDINDFIPFGEKQLMNDSRIDNELIAQYTLEQSWEDLVVSGPIIVNYVGNLMVLSSKKDFSFKPQTPNHVYVHIKYPSSFRTTLVQVAHEIYNAFMNAHTNMDRIQLNMQQIPSLLKTILKLLTSASPRLIQIMLPSALENLERIAKQSADYATGTLKKFNNVTALLQEVMQVTIDTYGANAEDLNKTNILVSNSLTEQDSINAQLVEIRTRYNEARLALQKAREDYYNAYHAISIKPQRIIGSILVGVLAGSFAACLFVCGSSHSPVDNTQFDNAKQNAELALQALKYAEAEYDRWYSQMLEKQNKLTSIIVQLSQLNMAQTDYQTMINILVSATREMTDVEKQWVHMTEFFSGLSIRAEATRETVLHEFISTINAVLLNNENLDDADREYFVSVMLDTVDQIDRDAHLLYVMANTYYNISSRYMITQIAQVTAFTVIQTDEERETHMKYLAQETLIVSSQVSRYALERRQQYELRSRARQNQYKEYIQQLIIAELGSSIGK